QRALDRRGRGQHRDRPRRRRPPPTVLTPPGPRCQQSSVWGSRARSRALTPGASKSERSRGASRWVVTTPPRNVRDEVKSVCCSLIGADGLATLLAGRAPRREDPQRMNEGNDVERLQAHIERV